MPASPLPEAPASPEEAPFPPPSGLTARRARLEALRRRLRLLEPQGRARRDALYPLLVPAALNEVRAAGERDRAAATGFALALASHRARATGGALAFVAPDWLAAREGVLYPPALAALGVDTTRLLAVFAPDEKSLLWAAEETARSPAVAAAIVEAPPPARRVDLGATRRLSLAAADSGTTVILLRTIAEAEPSAAARRWRVSPAPSAADPDDDRAPGPARWTVDLERCRAGARGLFLAELAPDAAEPLLRVQTDAAFSRASRPLVRDRPAEARRAG